MSKILKSHHLISTRKTTIEVCEPEESHSSNNGIVLKEDNIL